ncbi:MAG: efflux RND transporter permease subunit, partial [Bacteroidota bacterium]
MKLPAIALKNYQFVLILVFLGTLIGMNSLINMPRNEDPNPAFPFFTIVAVFPGTGPEDIEELVVDPIEEAVDQLDDITEIKTKIEEGVAVISVEAEFGIDTDDKYDELVLAVRNLEAELPPLFSLDVNKFEPNSRVKISQLAISGQDKSFAQLRKYAEDLEKRLQRIKGLDDVTIEAIPDEIVKVTIDFQRLAAFQVPVASIVQTLRAQNLNIPSGDLSAGDRSFSIKSSGSYRTIEEIRNTVVKGRDNQLVRLSDLADVRYDYAEDNWIARVNGERSVMLSITQKSGVNLVALTRQISEVTDMFQAGLPQDVELVTVFEQAPAVERRINDFFSNLIQGVLFVGVIVLIFLGWRPSLVIMTVIPLSIVMAIGLLDRQDYALQQISIAGLVIALGLLVDNGIVVVENIKRFISLGYSVKEAAIKGTSEVGYAIISSTVTTLLAFYPLANLESGPGEFLRTLPLTVIFALIVSLVLALIFTPIMAGRFLKEAKTSKKKNFNHYFNQIIDKVYHPLLLFSLRRGWVILLVSVVSLMGSLVLFPSVGVSFFPTADKPMLLVEVEAPRGSSLERTDRAIRYVTDFLETDPFVKNYVTNTGHGNPMIYYNRPN